MKVIITAAGLGSRFKNIGIDNPKYKIIAKDKTLYEWAMLSLEDFFDSEFIFIFRSEMLDRNFINQTNKKLGIKNYNIIDIDYLTDGQATTAFLADKLMNEEDEVIIYNIDTYVKPYKIKKVDITNEMQGFIPAIIEEGDRWSFIKLDDNNNVINVAEKKPISNLATIGLYYFKSWKEYKEIYINNKQTIKKENKEVYIAPMYKYLIKKGVYIGSKILNKEDVFILGTPEELQVFDSDYLDKNIKKVF